MNIQAVIELQYFPSVAYFASWLYFDDLMIESKESYAKQTYRNRCRIKTANKVEDLVVPIRKGNSNIPIQETRIDYQQSWIKDHWGAIQSAYGKAPFYEHYAPDICRILNQKSRFLFDMNLMILEFFLNKLGINKKIFFTQKYEKIYPDKICDLRSRIHPKQDLLDLSFYCPEPYTQVFGNQFVGNLSTLDLLFCQGPESLNILHKSIGFF